MEFLTKSGFYIMYGTTILMMVFFFGSALYEIQLPTGKPASAFILSLGGVIACFGIYFGYHILKNGDKFLHGCGILSLTWLIAIVFVFSCLMIFSPPNWQ